MRSLFVVITLVCLFWGLTIGVGVGHIDQLRAEANVLTWEESVIFAPAPCIIIVRGSSTFGNGVKDPVETISGTDCYLWLLGWPMKVI